ncbi:MAG: hypothetical protein ACI9QD_000983 [Thermoproteota archaeon]|jgi:hypothetical protein
MGCCDNPKENSKKTNFNRDGFICYCFKYSKKTLFDAIQSGTEQEILNDIKSKMKDPGCFCETANPSGKCCLADLNTYIKHYDLRSEE